MDVNSSDTIGLLERFRMGDPQALREIVVPHRERLRRMVEMRLDRRLQGRLDPGTIVDGALGGIASRLHDYLREPRLSLFLWLRSVVGEHLAQLQRQQLGPQAGSVGRELALYSGGMPAVSSLALAAQLLGEASSPSRIAQRALRLMRIQEAINRLDVLDREVLALRHFEQLSRSETAQVLGLPESSAARRYLAALKHLRSALADLPGGQGSGFGR